MRLPWKLPPFTFRSAFLQQRVDELGVVHHLISTTQCRVFVLERVEAMRARGYDPLDAVTVQYGDVLHGLHLEQELVACATCRIAGAAFLLTEHRELDTWLR